MYNRITYIILIQIHQQKYKTHGDEFVDRLHGGEEAAVSMKRNNRLDNNLKRMSDHSNTYFLI